MRTAFRSRYVLMLETELAQVKQERQQLLNMALNRAGYGSIGPQPEYKPIQRKPQPVSLPRRMAMREAQANREFDAAFSSMFPSDVPSKGNGN